MKVILATRKSPLALVQTEMVAARLSEKLPFRKCVADDEFDSYIDEIVLGRDLARRIARNGGVRVTYELADAKSRRLSDHCPVGVDLELR